MSTAYVQVNGSNLQNTLNSNAYQSVGSGNAAALNVVQLVNVAFTAPRTIDISFDGTYLLDMVGSVCSTAGGTGVEFRLLINGVPTATFQPLTSVDIASASTEYGFDANRVYDLSGGSTVQLGIARTNATNMTTTVTLNQLYIIQLYGV